MDRTAILETGREAQIERTLDVLTRLAALAPNLLVVARNALCSLTTAPDRQEPTTGNHHERIARGTRPSHRVESWHM